MREGVILLGWWAEGWDGTGGKDLCRSHAGISLLLQNLQPIFFPKVPSCPSAQPVPTAQSLLPPLLLTAAL